jgi:hypothetical protein
MADEAPQARRRDAGATAASCCLQPVRCLDAAAHAAQPGERWTLWVKQADAEEAEYDDIGDIDPLMLVSRLKRRVLSEKKLDADPSFVSLRLVRYAGEEPTAEEEAAATVLSPRRTLRAAGVVDGGSLLAKVAGACNAAARAVACAVQRVSVCAAQLIRAC